MPEQSELSAEDRKLVTLARATRARTGAAEGAAVRDLDGRTYAAATVDLPSLQVSAVGVCVAMAVASGSKGLEAVVVLGEAEAPAANDLAAVKEFAGEDVPGPPRRPARHAGHLRALIASSRRGAR
ncbi:putative cytidine deaminase (Cytidine aminohydrolase) (CDA) [Nocardioidaceae bacterium Broad-1]|nr:putative cytidine deaminase (Cytidine aminohydrolase) (CDA) [Nocardioidaceae bacterium Broad-1]